MDVNTGSQLSINKSKLWFNNCNQNHPDCQPANSWFPKRVLQLGTLDNPLLRLHLRDRIDAQTNPQYATLSHCWGKLKIAQLLKSIIVDMVKSIDPSGLPKTFQEAISLTRTLGLAFIWIDSLCIIQDSHEDWLEQSSQMGKVYADSACNIVCGIYFPLTKTIPRDVADCAQAATGAIGRSMVSFSHVTIFKPTPLCHFSSEVAPISPPCT